jgi:hypothetical protein
MAMSFEETLKFMLDVEKGIIDQNGAPLVPANSAAAAAASAANEDLDKVRAAAEGRALMLKIVNKKLATVFNFPPITWTELERRGRRIFFKRRRDHPFCSKVRHNAQDSRGQQPAIACQFKSMRAGKFFTDPECPSNAYIATGNVYLCTERGKPHRCTESKCALVQENPEEPGTLTCPVSGRSMGAVMDDGTMYNRPSHDEYAQDQREQVQQIDQTSNSRRQRAPSAASAKQSRI